ncbi:MAG: hypothetical protein M3P30_00320 [Chloroflexota bacterium]|nr:hypothetical protein [Chloroflexota bacterium]
MPERKGRKHKSQRTRRVSGDPPAPVSSADPRAIEGAAIPRRTQLASDSTIPALRARYAGFIVALLTLTIGILTIAQGLAGDYGVSDAALRMGAGIALIVVALIIGVLVLVPQRIAAWLRR